MVRPKASDTIRDFASALANTVSTASGSERDWIARTGRHSMFSLLTKLAPKVCIRSRYVVRDERLIEVGFPDQTPNYCHFELIQVNQIKTKSMNRITGVPFGNRGGLQQVRTFTCLQCVKSPYALLYRSGISLPELNKLLESFGFHRIRVRLRTTVRLVPGSGQLGAPSEKLRFHHFDGSGSKVL